MLLIFVPQQTNRLDYVFRHIFGERLGIVFRLCTNKIDFQEYKGMKIAYGMDFSDVPFIEAKALLFEEDIHKQDLQIGEIQDNKVLFKNTTEDFLGFDIFAACFYCLSRYEEYLCAETDYIGRFMPENSWAFVHNCLDKAMVDRWIVLLKEKLLSVFPSLEIKEPEFEYLPTYDIDIAYCYKHKGFLLSVAGLAKQFFRFDFQGIKKRIEVLLGKKQDPYDNFDYLENIHKKYNLQAVYFFLVAQQRSRYDKNTSIKNKDFQQIIANVAQQNQIGWHASFQSFENSDLQQQEIDFLQKCTQKTISKNRFHYLHFCLPNSYNSLISNNIKEDYSMGYASVLGWRASTCSSFWFFDLKRNTQTTLRVYPLFCMGNQLSKIKKEELILNQLHKAIQEVKKHNGVFVSLFHQQSFSQNEFHDWQTIYESMLKLVCEDNN
ncbi:MAG: hypothetical protein J5606_05685 [Bacteroidales bacterium]|nr:hypothetical protein [Bacteroidales bacterium]